MFMIPYDAELECKQNIVVYDSNTDVIRSIECESSLNNFTSE